MGKATSQECPAASVGLGREVLVAVLEWGVTETQERWCLSLGSLLGGFLLWGSFILDFLPLLLLSALCPSFPCLILSFLCLIPPPALLYPCFHPFILAFSPSFPYLIPSSSPTSLFSLLHPNSLLHIFPSALSLDGRICIFFAN